MTQDPAIRSTGPGSELFEGAPGVAAGVVRVSVGPVSRLRSPIMEHRPVESLPPRHDGPSILLPPLRAFIGPTRFALLVAAPVLLFVSLQAAIIIAIVAPVLRALRDRANRTTYSFGEGFLPYRTQMGWPQGVQEDNDVRWNWSPVGNSHGVQG